MIKKTQNNYWI